MGPGVPGEHNFLEAAFSIGSNPLATHDAGIFQFLSRDVMNSTGSQQSILLWHGLELVSIL